MIASAAELDRWKAAAAGRLGLWHDLKFLRIYALSLTAGVVAVAAGLGLNLLAGVLLKGPPQTYAWKDRSLFAYDGAGRLLWRYEFPGTVNLNYLIDVQFSDLDGDGGLETVVPYRPPSADLPMDLRCLSERGKLRWRYAPARKVRDRSQQYSAVYHLRRFRVFPSPESKRANWVAASFVHHWSYPCQVAVLDERGRLRGEYWHSGHLDEMVTADLDGDGVHELLLAGVNSGRQQAVLVVLDPRRMPGASVQAEGDPDQLLDLAPATEKALVWFPRTALNRTLEHFNFAYDVALIEDTIKVQVKERMKPPHPYLICILDRNLQVISVVPSVSMRNFSYQLKASGELPEALSEAEVDRLRRQVSLVRKP